MVQFPVAGVAAIGRQKILQQPVDILPAAPVTHEAVKLADEGLELLHPAGDGERDGGRFAAAVLDRRQELHGKGTLFAAVDPRRLVVVDQVEDDRLGSSIGCGGEASADLLEVHRGAHRWPEHHDPIHILDVKPLVEHIHAEQQPDGILGSVTDEGGQLGGGLPIVGTADIGPDRHPGRGEPVAHIRLRLFDMGQVAAEDDELGVGRWEMLGEDGAHALRLGQVAAHITEQLASPLPLRGLDGQQWHRLLPRRQLFLHKDVRQDVLGDGQHTVGQSLAE